jgi:hypothetical protein
VLKMAVLKTAFSTIFFIMDLANKKTEISFNQSIYNRCCRGYCSISSKVIVHQTEVL